MVNQWPDGTLQVRLKYCLKFNTFLGDNSEYIAQQEQALAEKTQESKLLDEEIEGIKREQGKVTRELKKLDNQSSAAELRRWKAKKDELKTWIDENDIQGKRVLSNC